ncbi:PH domain-containing protein [Methanoplanus sp. FWC-SCC4]|uniref:PH domain-containing protein n=1 Tax=Methanochimaera problematica TaxID=2609417 RepID=A0AA97I4R3_9EURY|nr:PH domain-containing protein [Methanoplanus sp. FWC-SCC4]
MGLLNGMPGNASSVEISAIENDLEFIPGHDEQVVRAYKLVRDFYVLTNKG